MNQEEDDLRRDKHGRVIRQPSFKFDPWAGKFNKIIPKLGNNEVFEDDGFAPPLPNSGEIEQMKRFSVMKNGANLFGSIPNAPLPQMLLQKVIEAYGEQPANPHKDVPDEKKALAPLLAALRGNA